MLLTAQQTIDQDEALRLAAANVRMAVERYNTVLARHDALQKELADVRRILAAALEDVGRAEEAATTLMRGGGKSPFSFV
jgi:hypothetical protein